MINKLKIYTPQLEVSIFKNLKLTIMKKIIFLMGPIMLFLISCSTGKHAQNKIYSNENFEKLDTSERYFGNDISISEKKAKAMIAEFRYHKYQWPKKHILKHGGWATFNKKVWQRFGVDKNIVDLTLFLAAHISNIDSINRTPTIILRIKLDKSITKQGKGSRMEDEELLYTEYQYLAPSPPFCPPPGDCGIN